MSIKEAESSIAVLEAELAKLDAMDPHADELRLQIDQCCSWMPGIPFIWHAIPSVQRLQTISGHCFRISWSCMVIAAMEMMRPVRAALRPFMEEV